MPKVDFDQHVLEKKWTTTLNKTTNMLLKHLRGYHRDAVSAITAEIENLEASLRVDTGLAENLGKIERDMQCLATIYKKGKRPRCKDYWRINQKGRDATIERIDINQKRKMKKSTRIRWSIFLMYLFPMMRSDCCPEVSHSALNHRKLISFS